MTPLQHYNRLLENKEILKDERQATIVNVLQQIYEALIPSKSIFSPFQRSNKTPVQGLYLWGDVGRGKTFLMDIFFDCLPLQEKLRIHFHSFMKMVHEQLAAFQGEPSPIKKIAKTLARQARVICFDELVVNDIADAMLLSGLFKALYQEKITLLFTSNCAPDKLYLKGLQRESFLPAIDLITQHSITLQLASQEDYRLRHPRDHSFYYTPLNAHTEIKLQLQFENLSEKANVCETSLKVCDRPIRVRKMANKVAWFDFLEVCGIPRSQQDYLELAQQFRTIIISNVTALQPEQNDLARSFINMVDILYDTHTQLIMSADKPIEELYHQGRFLFEFARTRSRLIEMQTVAWHQKCKAFNAQRH